MQKNEYINIAEKLVPELHRELQLPEAVGEITRDPTALYGWKFKKCTDHSEFIRRDGQISFDFGCYGVGRLEFDIETDGPIDCPLRLKIVFGEIAAEPGAGENEYKSGMGRAWFQDEIIVLDNPRETIRLARRYAFRYVSIISEGNSPAYQFRIARIVRETTTSANVATALPLPESVTDDLEKIDRISLNTLKHCMQTVFEDGPKRDRRLWLGDFRLQALVNYLSFQNCDLCKRCLYLFAGTVDENGRIPSCVYERPAPQSAELFIYDYTALFVPTLLEYAVASGDIATATELWPTAVRQLEILLEEVDDSGLFHDRGNWWLFIDWHRDLDKQASEQALVIYCLKQALLLAQLIGRDSHNVWLTQKIGLMTKAAMKHLYDPDQRLFVSGEKRQISWATHAWMTLAEVIDGENATAIFNRLGDMPEAIKPAGPYLYHYVLEAMYLVGMVDQAETLMKKYWGGMVAYETDTFWEIFDPEQLELSPYGSYLVNSYCHAWSCTPAWFIRRSQKTVS